jgi:hypothetical protein
MLEKLSVLLGERPKAALQAAMRKSDEQRLNDTILSVVAELTPAVGAMQLFAGTVPKGWVPADGRAVSRSAYVILFRAIGTTYGAGDGSTTFNVPNETHPTLTWAIRR